MGLNLRPEPYLVSGSGSAAPVLQAPAAIAFGNLTAPGSNYVNLADIPDLLVSGSASGGTWSVVYASGTGGAGVHFSCTTEAAAGHTPTTTGTGWDLALGTYTWTVTLTNAQGRVSNSVLLTYAVVGDAANIGNTNTQNWPEANLNTTAADAVSRGLQRWMLSVGLSRPHISYGTSFTFGTDVAIVYADTNRKPVLTTIQMGGGNHIVIEYLTFTGTPTIGTFSGHVHLANFSNSRVRFNEIGSTETISSYPGNTIAGVYTAGTCDTVLINSNNVKFRFRGVYLDSGTNLTVTDNWFDQLQGQGVFIGTDVDGYLVQGNIVSNPTRATGDTVSHCDGFQIQDASTTTTHKKAQNGEFYNNIVWQGFGNTAVSAFRGGGSDSTGQGVVSANTKVNWNIFLTWLASGCDYDSIGGASDTPQVIGNMIYRQLTGTPSVDNPFGSNKDQFNDSAGMNIAATAAVNATGTLILSDNVVDNTIIYLTSYASGATTASNNATYGRAANTDHVVGNPKTYVENYTDAQLRALTKADIKLIAMTAAARADLKGPVIDATTWRTTKLTSDTLRITTGSDTRVTTTGDTRKVS